MSELPDNSSEISTIKELKATGKQIVFTNGCFDILHIGHTRYLTEARALGDVLVIGLNSDSSVAELKGQGRPVIPEAERKEMLLSLKMVDYVCIFSEKTPKELIEQISPDVLVKGGDWEVKDIVGSDHVLANGGKVKSLQFVKDHSTTGILDKIKTL